MRFSLFRLALYTLCLTSFGLAQNAHAFSRTYQPMGEYIRASPLIIIADIETRSEPKYQQVLTVREVIRGDAMDGDKIELPLDSVARWIVPREATGVAVLLDADWRTKPSVNEVYRQPQEIAALRDFVKIYESPDERTQLLAIQAKVGDANPQYASQLLADFARMRDPKNFDIVLASYKLLGDEQKANLVNLLGRMNDERALPLLLEVLKSNVKSPRTNAAHQLTFQFPAGTGVTETFRDLAEKAESRDLTLYYLRKHDPVLADKIQPLVLSPWQEAKLKLKNGETAAAKEQLFASLEKADVNSWNLFDSVTLLTPIADSSEKARLRRLLQNFLLDDKNSWYAENAVTLLRKLAPDASSADSLIHVLCSKAGEPYSSWDKTPRAATFALREMGQPARKQATAHVIEQVKTRLQPGVNLKLGEETIYFCQLAWLADDATWQTTLSHLPKLYAERMTALQPLHDAAQSKQEAVALPDLLYAENIQRQGEPIRWIIDRLGDLRPQSAVKPLYKELGRLQYNGNSTQIEAALIAIGGEAVENGAMQLMVSPQRELRISGINILRALQGEKMRPLLRRMITEPNFGDRSEAIFQLGYIGQPDDLPLLLSLTDFWKNDLAVQTRAVDAVASIRDRCGYNVNGPIGK